MNDSEYVKVSGLTRTFKDFWLRTKVQAVENLNFTMRKGEVTGLLGPNGSGKTTTIRMLLGLLKPTKGWVKINNQSPHEMSVKRILGYLPEDSTLYKHLNAEETLKFFAALFGYSRKEAAKRAEQLLEMVGLLNERRRPLKDYSKGMVRRIGLAQALINDPELLILDEPTSGLDPLGIREIKNLIKDLGQKGKTILLSSHLLADVEDVCDRVLILYGGKLQQEGTVEELLVRKKQTTLTLEGVEESTLAEVLKLIQSQQGQSQVIQSHPRRSLEDLFHEIVKKAEQSGEVTSGARSSSENREDLLDQLMSSSGDPQKIDVQEVKPKVDQALIDQLTDEKDKPTS